MTQAGIYRIRNTDNGKVYIGSARNIKDRFGLHHRSLCNGNHHSKKLQRAWIKYGEQKFVFEKILLCSKENLIFFEQRAIDVFDAVDSGYNVLRVAGSSLGHKASDETKRKLSLSHKGKSPTTETRAKLSIAGMGNKNGLNYVPTAEQRLKVSLVHKGKLVSAETKTRLSVALKNPSAHLRVRISERMKGNLHALGTAHTEEAKKRIGAAHKGKIVSDETKARQSASQVALWAKRRFLDIGKGEKN